MTKSEEWVKKLKELHDGVDYDSILEDALGELSDGILEDTFGELSNTELLIVMDIMPDCVTDEGFDFTRFLSMAERKLDRFTDIKA